MCRSAARGRRGSQSSSGDGAASRREAERRRGARRGQRSDTRAANILDGWVRARGGRRDRFGVQNGAKARAGGKIFSARGVRAGSSA
jgi:hypothetical protein